MFRNRLSELRKSKGYNMKQTAAMLNLPYTTYVGYEKGEREPDSEKLILLSNFFNCSIDYLIYRSDNPNGHTISDDNDLEAIEIGKRIHDKRIELHITQEELGAAVGMNKSTVQRYETGQVKKIKLPVLEAVQQNANLQFLHRHCSLSPIFSRNSISHFLSIVNKNPAVQIRKSPAVLPGFSFQFLVNTRNVLQDLFQCAAFRNSAAAVGITCRSCT